MFLKREKSTSKINTEAKIRTKQCVLTPQTTAVAIYQDCVTNMKPKEQKKNKDYDDFCINLINIQGLTNMKMVEIESMINDSLNLMCLTETQLKCRKIKMNNDFISIDSMRSQEEAKGGGLLILYKKNDNILLEKVSSTSTSKDFLHVKGKIYNLEINIILVYFMVESKEHNIKNSKMRKEIERLLKDIVNEPTIVLGDFNGHVGFKGKQRLNENGKMILQWMEKFNLIMLNDDPNCIGEYTWNRRDQKSVVDFALVNSSFYDKYSSMFIDEDKSIYDLSDHNLIRINLKVKQRNTNSFKKAKWVENEYYKTDEASLSTFVNGVEEKLKSTSPLCNKITQFNQILTESADSTLKATYRRKKQNKKGGHIEPPWMNNDIRNGIKERKRFNRLKRNAINEEEKENLTLLYLNQKEKVQSMIREKMFEYEDKKTKEIRDSTDRGKHMWKYIHMLRAINTNKQDQCIYNNEGKAMTKAEAETALVTFWSGIYQQRPNNIEEFWNAKERKKYIDENYVNPKPNNWSIHEKIARAKSCSQLLSGSKTLLW